MTPEQRVTRARQAEQALEFAAPAFDYLKQSYFDRIMELASTAPWEAKKITALAQAIRVTELARAQIQGLVDDGIEARAAVDHAREIEKMSDPDRRLLNIASWRR